MTDEEIPPGDEDVRAVSEEDLMLEQRLSGERSESDPAWRAAVEGDPDLEGRLMRLGDLRRELDSIGETDRSALEEVISGRGKDHLRSVIEDTLTRGVPGPAGLIGNETDRDALESERTSKTPIWKLVAAAVVIIGLGLALAWPDGSPDVGVAGPYYLDSSGAGVDQVLDFSPIEAEVRWTVEPPPGGAFQLTIRSSEAGQEAALVDLVLGEDARTWRPSAEDRSGFVERMVLTLSPLDAFGASDAPSLTYRLRFSR